MPKISVIIPVYNAGQYLEKCLDSITNQVFQDVEIICINDSSTDNSLEILKKHSKTNNKIKIIDFKENKGAAIARNQGIKLAQGEYVSFVDSDDYIDLDFYEKLYKKTNNADLVIGNIKEINTETNKIVYTNFIERIEKNKIYFNINFSTAIYKKTLLENNNIQFTPNIFYAEDRELPIKAAIYAKTIKTVNNTCYNYVRHKKSITKQNLSKEKLENIIAVWTSIFDFLANNDKLTKQDTILLKTMLLKEYCYTFVNIKNALYGTFVEGFIPLYHKSSIKNKFFDNISKYSTNKDFKGLKKFLFSDIYSKKALYLRGRRKELI